MEGTEAGNQPPGPNSTEARPIGLGSPPGYAGLSVPGCAGPSPVGNGVMAYTGTLAGWMTLLDSSTAIFTYSGSTTPCVYRETSQPVPLCQ
jgi:hypothetical protein